jgi:hypothetical protein
VGNGTEAVPGTTIQHMQLRIFFMQQHPERQLHIFFMQQLPETTFVFFFFFFFRLKTVTAFTVPVSVSSRVTRSIGFFSFGSAMW